MDEREREGQLCMAGGLRAFSVSISQQKAIVVYINEQARHHTKRSFEEEFLAVLKKHSIEYDPKYVWG
jgi:putative transposase